jgi:hypothetical protein
MPRKNDKQVTIDLLERRLIQQQRRASDREFFDEEDSLEDERDRRMTSLVKRLKVSRYIYRKSSYRKRLKFDLNDCLLEEGSVHYNDTEFLHTFRMTRESFFKLLNELSTKKAFVQSKFKKQRPIAFQLLVFLYRIGKEGTGGSSISIGQFFGIGIGSVNNYVRRCIKALNEIKKEVVYWPNQAEKDAMKKRLAATGFRHCVGIIDGTLVVLDFRPEAYHECYYSRKSVYAINLMVVCDDQKRIIFYLAGWPGSTHDNRVFRNSKLFKNRLEYFEHMEYLLGDSAYSASSIMVQAFKKNGATSYLPDDQHNFNTMLAEVRIASEHCIGILKGRFGCLKRNNIQLRKTKKELKELIEIIGSCVILHNMLLNYDEDSIPNEWYDQMVDEIDWTLYDEEEFQIAQVGEDEVDRRSTVFHSISSNYFV